jgi:UDP-N-acetyl-D-mannosaminuronic acid dehydrogenase
MPTILQIKPEEIDTVEKRRKYTVCVIGCGQKGILYAMAFADSGFKVKCVDADQSVVKRVNQGKTSFFKRDTETKLRSLVRTGQIVATNDLKTAVSQSDIIIMTTTPKIDDRKNPDFSEVESNCRQVGAALRPNSLFVYTGTSALDFTENIKETLENTSGFKNGKDFGLVYNPLRISDEHTIHLLSSQELRVAGLDKNSLNATSIILGTLTRKEVIKTDNLKAAELATLFEAAIKDVQTALANELAILCEEAESDYFEVLKLLNLQKLELCPSISEKKDENETYVLLENAENLNIKLKIPKIAKKINEEIVGHAVSLTKDALQSCGKTFRRSRVAVLGSSKPSTTTVAFAEILGAKGAKVSLYDALLPKNEPIDTMQNVKRSLNEAVEGTDCIVLFTDRDEFNHLNLKKLRAIMKTQAAIVDLRGNEDPREVKKEGFIYRGFGRGGAMK